MKLYGIGILILSLVHAVPAYAGFWSQCSIYAAPVTMEKIAYVESGGNPYAIDDDTSRRSYSFGSGEKAVQTARVLVDEGHNVDLGLVQINIANIRKYGIGISEAFNPCYNVFIGSYILYQGYGLALRRFGSIPVALYRALEYYNSGHFYGDSEYANKVWEALN